MKKEILIKITLLIVLAGLFLVALVLHIQELLTAFLLYAVGVVSLLFIKIGPLYAYIWFLLVSFLVAVIVYIVKSIIQKSELVNLISHEE